MTRFELDSSARRIDGGRIVLGGSPLRLFRLSAGGAALIDRIAAGEDISGNHQPLTDRLLDAGALHPRSPNSTASFAISDVTLVIPAYNAAPTDLSKLIQSSGVGTAIVIDDASSIPIGEVPGADVIRLMGNAGPAAARAAGCRAATTPLIACVDTDVAASDGWISGLLAQFDDERVGLVAPRVASAPGSSLLARYEQWRSPLDLGSERARIRAGSRVSYVPGAAFIVRAEALADVNGFDESLRWGEDVDFVWRLDAAGWRCRYEPSVTVEHAPKPAWRRWLGQRFAYGSSAAPLAARHPGALAPVRVSGWSALSWLLLAGGRRAAPVGLAVAGATTVALTRKLRPMERPLVEAIQLAGRGHLYAGRIIASGLTRSWWPVALLAAVVSRRARHAVLAAAIVPSLIDWQHQRPALDPVRAVALRLADDVAYGTGVWAGVLRTRSIAALIPDLSNWPPKRPANEPSGG